MRQDRGLVEPFFAFDTALNILHLHTLSCCANKCRVCALRVCMLQCIIRHQLGRRFFLVQSRRMAIPEAFLILYFIKIQ